MEEKLTKEDVCEYLYAQHHSRVAINRVKAVMDHVNNLVVFSQMTQQQFLSTYEKLPNRRNDRVLTRKRQYDLGTKTWKAFAAAQAFVKGEKLEEKIRKEETERQSDALTAKIAELRSLKEEIATMNSEFTLQQLVAAAAFMRHFGLDRVDLSKLRSFCDQSGFVWK